MNEASLMELWEAYTRLHVAVYGRPPTQRTSSKDDIILAICDLRSPIGVDTDIDEV